MIFDDSHSNDAMQGILVHEKIFFMRVQKVAFGSAIYIKYAIFLNE